MPLVMGIGLLFRLDDSCRAKHAGERHVRAAGDESGPHVEDKFDTVADLPGAVGSDAAASSKSSSSNKKKAGGSSSSNKKKAIKAVPTPADEDFDVTSNLGAARPATAAGAVPIGRLTSEDEGTDAEEEEKRARLAQLAAAPAADQAAKPAGKKKMSAAERKRLKKGTAGQPSAADAAQEQEDDEEEKAPAAIPVPAPTQDDSSDDEDWGPKKKGKKGRAGKKAAAGGATAASAAPAAAVAAAPKPLPRGKRNKLKRTAARYANQDEEDLVLAASLLGLQNVEKKKEEVKAREKMFLQPKKSQSDSDQSSDDDDEGEKEEKAGASASAATAAAGAAAAVAADADNDDSAKVCFGCKQRGHIFALCPQRVAGGTGDMTFAQARRAAETAEESEVQQLMAEEGVVAEDSEEAAAASGAQAEAELNGLTGRPLPDDLLHFALPVCAPYDALSTYKYKLKLMPGAAKKGKAAKQAMSLFMQNEKVTSAEKELLKLVPGERTQGGNNARGRGAFHSIPPRSTDVSFLLLPCSPYVPLCALFQSKSSSTSSCRTLNSAHRDSRMERRRRKINRREQGRRTTDLACDSLLQLVHFPSHCLAHIIARTISTPSFNSNFIACYRRSACS